MKRKRTITAITFRPMPHEAAEAEEAGGAGMTTTSQLEARCLPAEGPLPSVSRLAPWARCLNLPRDPLPAAKAKDRDKGMAKGMAKGKEATAKAVRARGAAANTAATGARARTNLSVLAAQGRSSASCSG